MNSTRTWVTPPREPRKDGISARRSHRMKKIADQNFSTKAERTGTAEDTGDLDELSGLLAGIHLGGWT